MFDYETTLSSIDYKVRQLVDENKRLKETALSLTEKNEELTDVINDQKKNNRATKRRKSDN